MYFTICRRFRYFYNKLLWGGAFTLFGTNMGVKTKCTKEEQRQKDRYPVYIRRLAARHPRTHRETKCYFGDTFVLHLNQI